MVVVHQLAAGDLCPFVIITHVDMNFGAGTARAAVPHFPEIILFLAIQDPVLRKMPSPQIRSFLVPLKVFGGIALEYRGIEAVTGNSQPLRKQFPGPADGFILEIVAERPISQHLKHCMMIGIQPHLFQVVVLPRHPETFLSVGNPLPAHRLIAQKNILELVHPCIGKHQRWVILHHHGGRRYDLVPLLRKKIQKCRTYFFGCHHLVLSHLLLKIVKKN